MSGCGRKSLCRLAAVSFFMVLAACGGQDNAPVEPAGNQSPVAVLDGVAEAESGETVELDGSASHDPDGDTLAFEWSQPEGQDVALSIGGAGKSASFTAPQVDEETTLLFTVKVGDGELQDEASRSITIFPAGIPQQVSLDFSLVRMSAHENGDVLEEVDGKLKLEILAANGDVVDTQDDVIRPGLPVTFEIPEEGGQFRYRVIAWSDDAYYFLPGSTDYVFGREYSLSELLVQETVPVRLEVHEHAATAYLRTVHVVTENDPDHPDLEPGTRITESKIHIAGRNEAMSLSSCAYSWSDYAFQDTTGYPLSDLSVIETFGSCPEDVDNHVLRIELSPEAWQAIRNDDSGHDDVMVEWTSYYMVAGSDDEFHGGVANRSLGARLFIDGERIY